MQDDTVVRAREALQRAQRDIRQPSESTQLTEALGQIAAALDRIEEREKRSAETQRNMAVQQALFDARLLRVERNRLFAAFNRILAGGVSFYRRGKGILPNGLRHRDRAPASGGEKAFSAAYSKWVAHELAALPSVEEARAISEQWARKPRISVALAVLKGESLSACLDSIERQAYPNWELCVAADSACEPRILAQIRDFEAKCGPIRYIAKENLDHGAALNAAAALATGDYFSILEEHGILSPFALHYLVEALQQETFDVLYSDEDALDAQGRRVEPVFKPDWSPDLLTSCMYLGRLFAVRRERFLECGGLSSQYAGAELLDLVLRLSEEPSQVHHIRRVLYHSLPGALAATMAGTTSAASEAVADAVSRRENRGASCLPDPRSGAFVVRREGEIKAMSAIICSKSPELLRTCLESLRATAHKVVQQIIVVAHEEAGPNLSLRSVIERAGATLLPFSGSFNFAAMNNLGASAADAPNLLFLNDDVQATAADWAEMLSEQVSRQEVGVAGAVLWYPSGLLQHAGVVVGVGDGVGHVGRYMDSSKLWPWLLTTRNVSAVTGACFAIRKELFDELDGFDVGFPNNYNDVDLCFRARAHGYRVICVPVSGLIHEECQSRPGITGFEERYRFYMRWADLLGRPDPYYSLSLSPTEEISLNLSNDRWYRSLLAPANPAD